MTQTLQILAAGIVSAVVSFFAYRSGYRRGRDDERWRLRQ